MKSLLFWLGIVLVIVAIVTIAPYILDYKQLSQYGKGYVIGKFVLLAIGVVLVYASKKVKRTQQS